LAARRSHSTKELENWPTESTRDPVTLRVLAQKFTQYALPPLARHQVHVVVEGGPATLHFLIGDDGLIRFAGEVESLEGWHAVAFARGTSILGTYDAYQM
jgi:hypothetical protein